MVVPLLLTAYTKSILSPTSAKLPVLAPPLTMILTVGVSPKSYGFYHQRKREGEGAQFLHTNLAERVPADWLLPYVHQRFDDLSVLGKR